MASRLKENIKKSASCLRETKKIAPVKTVFKGEKRANHALLLLPIQLALSRVIR